MLIISNVEKQVGSTPTADVAIKQMDEPVKSENLKPSVSNASTSTSSAEVASSGKTDGNSSSASLNGKELSVY